MGLPSMQQTFELALQHHQAGRLTEAEPLYRQILAQQPGHAGALHFLGVLAHQVGQNEVAVDLIQRAIALNPNWPQAYGNLGSVLQAMGKSDDAIAAFRQAIVLQPNYPMGYYNLGNGLQASGRLDEAIAAFRQAIALQPSYPQAYDNLGTALQVKGNLDEAIAAHRQAVALNPNVAQFQYNLGTALQDRGHSAQALAAYRQTIALKPDFAQACNNLGTTLRATGQPDQALAAYRRAIAIKPDYFEAHNNLGVALQAAGQRDQAIAAFRQASAIKPDFAEARYNLSLGLLRGDYAQGWQEYEYRWQSKEYHSARRHFAQPQWDGGPLDGRTILLHAEQGLGDTIQFIRYLPLVVARGGKVIVECQPELRRLIQAMDAHIPVVAKGQALPDFDLHCPLMSLPKAMKTMLASIPHDVPYLSADPTEVAKWRDRLAEQSSSNKVGLGWAGNRAHNNDRNRSMKLAKLAALAQVSGVQFYSLQKGDAATEAKSPPPGMELIDLTKELKDFADTAGLIANLDLVIAVDTAVVHLAGAMGKRVWTLLPFTPDWRWLLEREDSPWYPTMRLFRQPSIGDWDSVIGRVAKAVADQVQRG